MIARILELLEASDQGKRGVGVQTLPILFYFIFSV